MTSKPWPTSPKMPQLVDGEITASQLVEAFTVLGSDGPEVEMTLAEVVGWLELHVREPRPPAPAPVAPSTPGGRRAHKRYSLPAGRPGRRRAEETRAAA